MRRYDVIIIGAGLIGLATALQLVENNPDLRVVVVEKESRVAAHQSGHNSGVIHSGIYYRSGSLKARNCVEGVRRLEAFCQSNDIPIDRCGKVIVATSEEEVPRLAELERRGHANGVLGLEMIGPERLREIEPHAAGIKALYSPNTAIVDYVRVAEAYADHLRKHGVEILLGEAVKSVEVSDDRVLAITDHLELNAHQLVNCAGVRSDQLARQAGHCIVDGRVLPFRGEYYRLSAASRSLVNGLIYPVPDPTFPFLGVHLTRMIDGSVEAGPNAVLAFARDGYRKQDISFRDMGDIVRYRGFWNMVKRYWRTGSGELYRSFSKTAFLRDLQRLMPALSADDLDVGGAGVRAQMVRRDGTMYDDFLIKDEERCLHLLNAPSPGATASLAIGAKVAGMVLRRVSG